MKKIYTNVFLYTLIIFSLYSAFIIGFAWDESAVISIAKLRLKYLSSLGAVDYKPLWFSHYYPGTYPVIAIFITQLFHKSYELEVLHILNTIIGISTIFGVSKIARELFNKKIGYIVFLISFFNPVFFGHMAINERDLVIAFCNIWMAYTLIKYLKYHHVKEKKNKCIIILGILFGLGLSCRLSFFVTLLPLVIFLFFDAFYIRKFCNKKLLVSKFIKDVFLSLPIAYLVLIIFWPEVYPNIFILPFKFFLASFDFRWGTAQGLINGIFYDPMQPPKNYILILLFYKMPEYLIMSYLLFFLLLLKKSSFFIKKFDYFYYKILLIIFITVFPNFLLIISPYPIYDNLRLFLYIIPYLSIIPAIFIFYLIDNFNLKINKILMSSVLVLFFYSVYNFFLLTPYQYTYLNSFSGKFSESQGKFESDYWGTSMKQLIKKTNLKKNIQSNIAVCGMAKHRVKYYLKKFGFRNIDVVSIHEDYDYIIMTNRVFWQKNADDFRDLKTCYDQFPGKTISSVKRKGLALSLIRRREI